MATDSSKASDGASGPRADVRQVPAPTRRASDGLSRAFTVMSVVAIVAVLYFAQAVLIPITLAALLSFVLAPLVLRLVRLGLGRTLSVLSVSTFALLFVAALGWMMASQTLELAEKLPQYRDNIRQKLNSAKSQMNSTLGRASDSIEQIGAEMAKPDSRPAPAPDEMGPPLSQSATTAALIEQAAKPVPVEVVEKPGKVVETLLGSFTPLLGPLATAGIVIVFVFLILLNREDLRDRVIFLIGTGQLTTTTQAMDEGASRVSRYLAMLLIVNSSYGLSVGIGLWIIGVPNAVLFGVLAGLVRFVPYVGPLFGAALPIAMSLAVFDSWDRTLITIGLFVILEVVSNNIIEPCLYGSRTGISAVAVLVAAVFWGWLWGPVGLIMATPLTVCLVVMGRYVPRLEFLNVLLGDGPGLPPEAKVYQRLLAAEYDDVFHCTQEYLKDKALIDLYQDVLIPALAMAEHDRQAGRLEDGQDRFIYRSLRDLIEELGDLQRSAAKAHAAEPLGGDVSSAGEESFNTPVDDLGSCGAPGRGLDGGRGNAAKVVTAPALTAAAGLIAVGQPAAAEKPILCIAARDEADEISALMLAQLLMFEGLPARVAAATTLMGDVLEEIDTITPGSVCVCAMPPAATSHARYASKKVTARFADMKVVVGIWNSPDLDRARERIRTSGTEQVVSTFGQAIKLLRG